MLKIKDLLKLLIETQKQINTSIKELKEDLEPKYQTLTATIRDYSDWKCNIETNVYTKEQTIETINKEINYRKEYEKCENRNKSLLQLIERYCKYKDKDEVIKIFEVIDEEYEVKKRKTVKVEE